MKKRQTKNLLLYLMPGDISRLNDLLCDLDEWISRESHAGGPSHEIRKGLYDLMMALSPLSRTKRIIGDILELTEDTMVLKQEEIIELAEKLKEIYRVNDLITTLKD